MKRKKVTKLTSLFLASLMVISMLPSGFAFAAEDTSEADESTVTEEAAEESTEIVVDDQYVIEDTEGTTEEVTEETTEETITEEETVSEENEEVQEEIELIPTFDQLYDGVDTTGIDFSSCELLIATEDAGIFTADTEVVSEYNGIYLTRYQDVEQTKSAYTYYWGKADLVEVNTTFKGADGENDPAQETEETSDDEDVPQQEATETEEIANDGHGEADLTDINTGDDAFSNVNDIEVKEYKKTIALIDSGIDESIPAANIVDKISVIGDDPKDDNGHGTKMAKVITEINPNVQILSIKALDKDNKGQASDIYAAIEYAIDCKVSIINLSLTSINTAESELVVSAINEAIEKGIVVVGAAGNYGKKASYFVPGCVEKAIICAATDENGVKLAESNYGETVDYYVAADSTSEAAAKVTGLISKNGSEFTSDIVRTSEVKADDKTDVTVDTPVADTDKEQNEKDDIETEKEIEAHKEIIGEDIFADNPWLTPGVFYGQDDLNGLPKSKDVTVNITQTSNPKSDFVGTVSGVDWYSEQGQTVTGWSVVCASGHKYADPGQHYGKGVQFGLGRITMYVDHIGSDGYVYYKSNPVEVKSPDALKHADGWQELQVFCKVKLPPPPEKPKYGAIQVLKVDKNGSPLANAKFEITGPDGYSKIVTTSGEGIATVSGLSAGSYTVEEIQAPDGFDEDPNTYNVNISFANTFSTTDRSYSYVFDSVAYMALHPDVGAAGYTAKYHYYDRKWGLQQGFKSSYTFNPVSYGQNYTDLNNKYGNDYESLTNHYINYGVTEKENRRTLSAAEYRALNTGVTGSGTGMAIVKVVDEATDKPAFAYVKKASAVSGYSGSLEGAVFRLYKDPDEAENAVRTRNFSTALKKFTTDSTGDSNVINVTSIMDKNNLDVAITTNFYIVEQKAPAGFTLDTEVHKLTVDPDTNNTRAKEKAAHITISDNRRVYMTMTKQSSNPDCTNGNPNYNLNGAQYMIFPADENNGDSIARAAQTFGDYSKAIGTMNIKKDGTSNNTPEMTDYMKKASNGAFMSTIFYVFETKTGKNYKMDPRIHRVTINPRNSDSVTKLEVSDDPVDDPFKLYVEKTIKGSTGGEQLEGAEFTVKYYALPISMHYTFGDLDNNYTPDETLTITTQKHTDPATGETKIYAELPEGKMFPLGYLTIEETKAPTGYEIDGSTASVNGKDIPIKMAFELRSKGNSTEGYDTGDVPYIVYDDKTTEPAADITVQNPTIGINVEELQIRADIEVIKYDERKEGIEGAEFEVLNLDTNESHTFKVDRDGYYCSDAEYVSHSAENGLWFAEGPQGTADTPDDEQRALPVGKYRLTEKDAKGHQKEESIDFEVVDDNDGKPIKIFDKGRGDGLELISDMDMPDLGTKAFAETSDGKIKIVPADKGQTVHDICTYKNLKCGTTFTLIGKLMKKNGNGTAEPFLNNGEEVVGRTTFTTKDTYEQSQFEASGEATVEFADLDFTDLEDTEFVVYERLYLGDVSIDDAEAGNYEKKYIDSNNDVVTFPIKHEKADDKDQTITTPGGITTAMGGDGTKNISTVETETVTIVDTVEYFNLHPGTEYEAVGKLYLVTDKDDGKKYSDYSEDELKKMAIKDDDGNVITASTKFTATKANGTVDVTFTFPAAKLTKTEGESVVVFEDCYDNNKVKYFSHAVVTDTQIVNPPSISTTAKGTEGRSELAYNQGKFVDTIHYSNLQANSTFLVKGIAMDKDTKEPLKLNGKEVIAEAEFTTGDANMPFNAVKGDFDLEFKITEDQYEDLKGKDIVIYESLYNSVGTLIAQHTDLSDKGQELWIVKLGTTLTDKKTGTHVAYPDQETTLVDVVSYESLIPGKKYVMSGKLMNKATNKPLLDENGKEITSSAEFTASETGNGTVEVVFTFNAKILKIQGTSLVAFESVRPSDSEIDLFTHANINDKEQTVDIPRVGTKVSKSSFSSKDVIKFTDTISFTNLPTEYTYVAKGWLVDSKGNKLTVDGKEITAEKEFKPQAPNGTVDVVFPEFSGKGLNGKYVVYEEVYVKITDESTKTTSTHLVGEHKDLTDTNQQITVSPNVKTGDSSKLILMVLLLVAALMGIGTVIVIKRKRR